MIFNPDEFKRESNVFTTDEEFKQFLLKEVFESTSGAVLLVEENDDNDSFIVMEAKIGRQSREVPGTEKDKRALHFTDPEEGYRLKVSKKGINKIGPGTSHYDYASIYMSDGEIDVISGKKDLKGSAKKKQLKEIFNNSKTQKKYEEMFERNYPIIHANFKDRLNDNDAELSFIRSEELYNNGDTYELNEDDLTITVYDDKGRVDHVESMKGRS